MSLLGRQGWTSAHLGARASDLLDGRLAAAEESQVREHLAACRDCAEQVQAHRSLRAALRGLDVPGAPPGLVAGLLAVPARPSDDGGTRRRLRTVPTHPTAAARGSRPAPRARFGTAVVGTMALTSAGALVIGAVAGLGADPGPGSAVVTSPPAGVPFPADEGPPAQPAGSPWVVGGPGPRTVADTVAGTVGRTGSTSGARPRTDGGPPASVVVAPAVFRTR